MSRKRHTTEQIVNQLGEADVELAKGQSIAAVCRLIGITDRACFLWRRGVGDVRGGLAGGWGI